EFLVAGQVRRHHVQEAEPAEYFTVDEVGLGSLGVFEAGGQFHGHQDTDGQYIAPVTDDDGRAAGPVAFDQAHAGDFGDGVIIGTKVRKGSNVSLGTACEMGQHLDLPGFSCFAKSDFRGVEDDFFDLAGV